MITYKLVAGVFILLLIAYFVEVFGLVRLLRASYPDVWRSIGSPDLFSPVGQSKFFSLVLSRNRAVFQQLPEDIKKRCIRIRFYMVGGIALFLILVAMILITNQQAKV